MLNHHQYFTRSKAKSHPPSNESSISTSSSIFQISESVSMANSFTKAEDLPRLYDDRTLNSQSDIHFGTHHSTIEPKSPLSHSLKTPPGKLLHESAQLLQNEVDSLKAELHMLKMVHPQPSINKIDSSNIQATFPCSTNISTQPSTITSNITSIQYVVNIDPLQQMKDFVKPFYGNSEEDASKWIDSIVHFFDIIRLPGNNEELCFQYAPAFLKTYAYRWWIENKSLIYDWSFFKRMIIEQFGDKNEYLIEQQLNQRKQQPTEPVIKYYYDIIELCHKCDPTMSDQQKVRKLIHGLRLSLYQEAIKDDYSTPKQFLVKVQQLENIEKLVQLRQSSFEVSTMRQSLDIHPISSSMTDSSSHVQRPNVSSSFSSRQFSGSNIHPASYDSRPYYSWSESSRVQQPTSSNKISQTHYNAKQSSHHHDSSRAMNFQCYQCGEWGHFARDCYERNNSSPSPSTYRQQKNQ